MKKIHKYIDTELAAFLQLVDAATLKEIYRSSKTADGLMVYGIKSNESDPNKINTLQWQEKKPMFNPFRFCIWSPSLGRVFDEDNRTEKLYNFANGEHVFIV